MTFSRLGHDEYFAGIADLVAKRSTCRRRTVGCVLVDSQNHIVATGYNGVPAKFPHCVDNPCEGAEYKTGEGLDVCEAIHESTEYPNKSNYFHRPYDGKDVETFLKKICNALARDGFIRSPKGRRLKELESKRRAAIDVVMGMTETEPTVNAINKILKGTKVPLLGGK